MSTGATAACPAGRVGDSGAALSALRHRARDLTRWIDRVRQTEAVYARYHIDMSRDGASVRRVLTSLVRQREAALAFDELLRAVHGLRTSWELFRLRATAEGWTWREALRRTLPGLFEDDGGAGALRADTSFWYAAARTGADIAACFRWRLESGYC